jgi:hypothetical protein
VTRPSFASTITALRTTDRRFPWVQPTADEAEVADVLEELEQLHQPSADTPDQRGRFGRCAGCLHPWPCDAWQYGDQLAVQWLGRATERVASRARQAMGRSA